MMRRFCSKRHLNLLLLCGVLLGTAMMGCTALDPFQPPLRGEIPDGPGLFTGRQGAWIISRDIGAEQTQSEPNDTQAVKPSLPPAAPSAPPVAPKRQTPPM